jgi:hypothetical protein
MGAYYPRVAFCSLATLAASGPTACMAAAQPPSENVNGSTPGGFLGTYGTRIVVAGVVSGVLLVVVVATIIRYRRRKRSARVQA